MAARPPSRQGAKARSTRKSARRTDAAPRSRSPRVPGAAGAPRAKASRGRGGTVAAPVLLVAAVALAAWTLFPTVRMGVTERAQRAALQRELDGLQRRNDTLRRQVDRLKTPEGVEQVARTSLGMVRPGERAYIVAGTTASREASPASKDASPGARTSWLGALARLIGLGR